MVEMPKPEETGSTGTQEVGTAVVAMDKKSPLEGLPIVQKVEGLAATHSRSMGGEVAANLISGSFLQLSFDLQTTRQELRDTREELKETLVKLSDTKTKAAVLEERANAHVRDRHLKNLSLTAGPDQPPMFVPVSELTPPKQFLFS